jgi:HD superfamily phosphohydrolase
MTSREVRDPVHGFIELDPDEWRVVDSRAFQRLRLVQQLAMTHLVYPGARHTRFEHCLGACHVGAGLAKSINAVEHDEVIDTKRIRAAALCHDLGHGPFSHVSEFVYERFTGRHHIHEQISAGIVRYHEPIRHALGDDAAEWVAQLLEGEGHGASRSVERDIVAGPADVDKLDYLLRDSHYCGVNYGRFDLHKVMESARRASDPSGSVLAFHRDGIYAVEELLLARHHMHRQVYGHKTRIATDLMLMRAMTLGVEEGLLPGDIFAPPDVIDQAFVNDYLAWHDYAVVARLTAASEGSQAGELMRALIDRKLLRRCLEITLSDLTEVLGLRLAANAVLPQSLDRDLIAEGEAAIASAAGIDPLWVAFHWEDLQSPIGTAGSVRATDKDVYLVDDQGAMEALEETSEIFGQPAMRGTQRVLVYLRPPDGHWDEAMESRVKEAAIASLGAIARAAK